VNPFTSRLVAAALTFLGAGALLSAAGCSTDAFCFSDCESGSNGISNGTGISNGSGSGQGGEGGCLLNCGTGGANGSSSSAMCMPTNAGIEICDHLDNDCNGIVDDLIGIDFNNPKTCGTCDTNCYALPTNWDPLTVQCIPSANPGTVPGTCSGTCTQDYYDIDKNGSCEYYCVLASSPPPPDDTCNNRDDDCNGAKDDNVDFCSLIDCGKCNNNCVVLHGSPACLSNGMVCTKANANTATCQIKTCDCNGPGECWWDADKDPANGCEYQCDKTNGGVEVCDGIDNDCDYKIDAADDLSGDVNVNKTCYGSPVGLCADPAHAGVTTCVGGQIVCGGPNVLVKDQLQETCNGKDDDCDGVVDDNPTDAGKSCGANNNFPCTLGTTVCQNGVPICMGAVLPGMETCNGIDDDCDGQIDKVNGMSPPDSIGMCNVPLPPPAGATSPCKAGAKNCVGGAIVCQGSVGPTGPTDGCNIDSNCDGILTNQPNTQTDVHNCGMCGNDCLVGAVHANWGCVAGVCQFQGCQTGYWDLDNDKKCEYPCVFVSAQETCNSVDDNCNGQIDEGVVTPTPVQVCGVTPGAMSPECTSGVTVTCMNGAWKCAFPPGVCNPTCAGATETCDGLDNNCNGLKDENVANIGKPCASDDGLPPPGDGACRTTGTFICNGPSASKCSAVKDLAKAGPELCDTVDNDCDGLVDEAFTNKGSNAAFFVKPAVVKTGANTWTFAYEASRPTATTITAGAGDGYYCAAFNAGDPNCNDNTIPVAPAGTPLDKTPACSVPTKIPWFNVRPPEAEQTCKARGGHLCQLVEWQTACKANANCTWGYAPTGASCTTGFIPGAKYCNLGGTYDFDPVAAGDQDGLLVTGSASLQQCWADWLGANQVFDITGNLREITKQAANVYPLMGGSFNAGAETGATCNFTFYTADQNFQLFDLGFRCCFSQDPTL